MAFIRLNIKSISIRTDLKNQLERDTINISNDELIELFENRELNKEKILRSVYPYIIGCANKYCKNTIYYDDYLQSFIVAFIEAINNYNPDKGNFISFANFYILNEKFILAKQISIQRPRNDVAAKNVSNIISDFYNKYLHYPTLQEVQLLYDKI